MRYRVVEEWEDGAWQPLTTVFESDGHLFYFTRTRTDFHELETPDRLEKVQPEHLPVFQDDLDQLRLSPVLEVDLPEHPIQRGVEKLGLGTLKPEFVAENHFALLRRVRALQQEDQPCDTGFSR